MIQLIRERHTDLGSISGREKQSVEGDQSSGDRAMHPNEESSMAGTPRHRTRSRTLIPPLRLLLLWLIQGVDVLISALGAIFGRRGPHPTDPGSAQPGQHGEILGLGLLPSQTLGTKQASHSLLMGYFRSRPFLG
jgi:hypothetical protein